MLRPPVELRSFHSQDRVPTLLLPSWSRMLVGSDFLGTVGELRTNGAMVSLAVDE